MNGSPSTSSRAKRRASWLRRGGGAVLASAAFHAAAAVTLGGVFSAGSGTAGREPEVVDLDLAADVAAPSAPSEAAAGPATERPAAPRHRSVSRSIATPAAAASDDAPVARFALSAGTVATNLPATGPGASVDVSSASAGGGRSGDVSALGEGDVDAPAQLLASAPLAYPAAARQAEIEADLPLEIVVDAAGHVVSARALRHGGYGLDEAALHAIRSYRFSPAMRGGHAVAVRMRWTVQFRLR